jgi:alpha-amylase/alpha-mannosidase (GH57 family)
MEGRVTPNRFICVHGHFYQPPRENPWLEAVEQQDSAHPYHDWNERICEECYGPNTAARILDNDGFLDRILNNYEWISFNFGPTLLSWLEARAPSVYKAILEADARSQTHFSGHGSAMAQVYNHIIMPLANRRDKITQVRWGIADFEARFRRKPEGMWLAETAVDLETLDILARHGIRFTILSPMQASRIRPIGRGAWTDVRGGRIDPSRPYLCRLPGGEVISIFFYDGPISHSVAFEGLLNDGHALAQRLMTGFAPDRDGAQLVHIATDGESYGHHHQFGEMALSRALADIMENPLVDLTNYGEFLERFPPRYEVEIFEASSWSCAHGVGRWSYDCGCNSGGHPGWNQAWRAPLRQAMNWLRDEAARIYENEAVSYVTDPWLARDDYISVVLDRSADSVRRFLERHQTHKLTATEQVRLFQLLEMQRHTQLMFTSCGWFFDDISGLETVQNMFYAARTIQLARKATGQDLEPAYTAKLESAKSNVPQFVNGAHIYERFVRPALVDLDRVAGNYALLMLLEGARPAGRFYAFDVKSPERCMRTLGERVVLIGRLAVRSLATGEEAQFMFGAAKLSEDEIEARVSPLDSASYKMFRAKVESGSCDAALLRGFEDFADVFPNAPLTLKSLFRDDQRRVVYRLLHGPISQAIDTMRRLYDENAGLMRFLTALSVPLPKVLKTMTQFVLTDKLVQAFQDDSRSSDELRACFEEARRWEFELETEELDHAVKCALDRVSGKLEENPNDIAHLARLVAVAEVAFALPLHTNIWRTQTTFYRIVKNNFPIFQARADSESSPAEVTEWIRLCTQAAASLHVRLPEHKSGA